MKSVWNDPDWRALASRIDRLTPDAPARWGKFTAPQMVCHLTDALKMASGELTVASRNLPLRYSPLKQLVIYALPFPKGAPTASEIIARSAGHWDTEVAALKKQFEGFVRRGAAGPFVPHPAFGTLTPRAWGVLVYRHMDHHLKQFGC